MEAVRRGVRVRVTRPGLRTWCGPVIHHEVESGRFDYVHLLDDECGRVWLSTTDPAFPTIVEIEAEGVRS